MKYKNIYAVYLPTQYGIGMQPTKGNNIAQARERFKKRFPKKKIISIERLYTTPVIPAI